MNRLPDAPQLHHLIKTRLDFLVNQIARRTERQLHGPLCNGRIVAQHRIPLPFEQGLACRIENFQRPQDALPVCGFEGGCHVRVAFGKDRMQRFGALQPVKLALPVGPNGVGHIRHHIEPLKQGFEIEARATNQNGTLPPCPDICDGSHRVVKPAPHGVALGRVYIAIEPMLHVSHFFRRRAG
ncbi:hypothetical protein SAMN04488056_11080 [Cohaesibacter marisflavi]|uniref:Uncharacterized protein n=1 Tax=Cohaesibacter marisflavi TaxID=655353 RepID=A0A1I5IYK0_9HYPH|nr:hypothetical protein SAMN04488056_11080 [Cohaesibacter marisflavi]